jgi:hypothetical protein
MIRIAEAKLKSPWDGKLTDKPIEHLIETAIDSGDWVSIHTEEPWGGSLEHLKLARKMTSKPILAKGIHAQDKAIDEAFFAGADYVLCVGRVCGIKNKVRVIYEPRCLADIALFGGYYDKIMWNRRDLTTGKAKKDYWDEARQEHRGWLGCASLGFPFPEDAQACLFSVR